MADSNRRDPNEKLGVIISVEDDHLHRVDEVARGLRAAGLDDVQVLSRAGTITGSVEPHKLDDLRRVRGVSAVEPEHTIQLPPPDSEVQ
jgi:hypothetical protein